MRRPRLHTYRENGRTNYMLIVPKVGILFGRVAWLSYRAVKSIPEPELYVPEDWEREAA